MRAMVFDRYGDPDVLCLKNVPVPEPQDGEVLIRVGYAGVNPADSKARSDQSARTSYRYRDVNFPFVTVEIELYIDGEGPAFVILPSYGRDTSADFDAVTARVVEAGWHGCMRGKTDACLCVRRYVFFEYS
jgi:hypothetical protein